MRQQTRGGLNYRGFMSLLGSLGGEWSSGIQMNSGEDTESSPSGNAVASLPESTLELGDYNWNLAIALSRILTQKPLK
jgi:hypothetical protein